MISCQELKAKRLRRVKTPKEKCISKQSTKSYEYKIAKSSSPSVRWKLNISLTQKDTMDRGAWIKIQKERHEQVSKDKSPKSTKSAKWHGNEEQMNISVYQMLRSCGVQAGSNPKTEVKNETHTSGLERVILTLKPWFPFSWIGLSSMIQSSCICHLGNPYI